MRQVVLWLAVVMFVSILYGHVTSNANRYEKVSFSSFLNSVKNDQVNQIVIHGNGIDGVYKDGQHFRTSYIRYEGMIDSLVAHNVDFSVESNDSIGRVIFGTLLTWFPIIFFVIVWVLILRQMQSGSNRAMGFGKSKAKLFQPGQGNVTFDDVAGVDSTKEELLVIVDFLKNPKKFISLGGKIPKGCLLFGPPGTGKTLLARAVAGEAGVPFFNISGSDFVEMFVGVGASRVRDMFEQAKKHSPCIVFIDEIDAVGRHRGSGIGGGNDEREQTLNQLLVEMDGFDANEGIIILAATNRPDVLDKALLRPGRFDKNVVIDIPDVKGREQILKIHAKKIVLGPNVDLSIIARATPGFCGADLANLMNESALYAAMIHKKVVTMEDIEHARDKLIMGAERRSLIMTEQEKRLTAYHEAGHAICCIHMKASDPIHKATIMPRGRALGLVMRLPENDRLSLTRERMIADLVVAMGGRCAEEMIFGYDKVTSGASSDIKQATKLARSMVIEWGLSDKVGMAYYGNDDADSSGHHGSLRYDISNELSQKLATEINELLSKAYNQSKDILEEHIEELHNLAEALLEYETLSGNEITDLLAGKGVKRKNISKKNNAKKRSSFDKIAIENIEEKLPNKNKVKSKIKKKIENKDGGDEGNS